MRSFWFNELRSNSARAPLPQSTRHACMYSLKQSVWNVSEVGNILFLMLQGRGSSLLMACTHMSMRVRNIQQLLSRNLLGQGDQGGTTKETCPTDELEPSTFSSKTGSHWSEAFTTALGTSLIVAPCFVLCMPHHSESPNHRHSHSSIM